MADKAKVSKFTQKVTKEELTKITQIIEAIEADPKSLDFLEPVDTVSLGLDDYLTIIKNPMDISTVKKKLKSNKYGTVQDVFDDIQLIWNNCKTYNAEGSDIWKMAVSLEKLTKKLIDKHYKTQNKPQEKTVTKRANASASEVKEEREENGNTYEQDPDSLTISEKIALTDKVRKLTNDGLAAFVRLVQKECPNSIEDLDQEKLQIKVDMLDRRTFGQINQLIDTLLKVKEEKKN